MLNAPTRGDQCAHAQVARSSVAAHLHVLGQLDLLVGIESGPVFDQVALPVLLAALLKGLKLDRRCHGRAGRCRLIEAVLGRY
jgi:hypothetical protein